MFKSLVFLLFFTHFTVSLPQIDYERASLVLWNKLVGRRPQNNAVSAKIVRSSNCKQSFKEFFWDTNHFILFTLFVLLLLIPFFASSSVSKFGWKCLSRFCGLVVISVRSLNKTPSIYINYVKGFLSDLIMSNPATVCPKDHTNPPGNFLLLLSQLHVTVLISFPGHFSSVRQWTGSYGFGVRVIPVQLLYTLISSPSTGKNSS